MDVTDLIGIPFKYGARGPDEYDCYGLIQHLLLREQNIKVPDYLGYDGPKTVMGYFHSALPMWEKIPLQAGGILLFRVPGQFHVGYVLDDCRTFIHSWEQSGGVCIERLSQWQNRLKGCYRYAGKTH